MSIRGFGAMEGRGTAVNDRADEGRRCRARQRRQLAALYMARDHRPSGSRMIEGEAGREGALTSFETLDVLLLSNSEVTLGKEEAPLSVG
jgi:hypothetical protein